MGVSNNSVPPPSYGPRPPVGAPNAGPMAGALSPPPGAPINAPLQGPAPMMGAGQASPEGQQIANATAQSPQLMAQALQRLGGGMR